MNTLRAWTAALGTVALGVVLMKTTTPSDEELFKRFSPELQLKYYEQKAARDMYNRDLQQVARDAAASPHPVWTRDPRDVLLRKDYSRLAAEAEQARLEALERDRLRSLRDA